MAGASIGRAVIGIGAVLLVGLMLATTFLLAQPAGPHRARQLSLSLDGQHVLTLAQGRLCLPSLPQSACRSGIRQNALQLSYRTPQRRQVLVFLAAGGK